MGVTHTEKFSDHLQRALPDGFYLDWSKPDTYAEDKVLRKYNIKSKEDGQTYAAFSARPLPGCCGVLTVFYLTLGDKATIETALKWLDVISTAGSDAGYGSLLMTLFAASPLAKTLASTSGWQSAQFTNHKTSNVLLVLTKVLPVSKKKTIVNLTAGE